MAAGEQALPGALEHLANALGEDGLKHLSTEQLQGLLHSCAVNDEQQANESGAQPALEEMQLLQQLQGQPYQHLQMGHPRMGEAEHMRQLQALQALHPPDVSRVAGQLGELNDIGAMGQQDHQTQRMNEKLGQGMLGSQ